MLVLTLPGEEFFDDEKQEFITTDEVRVELEHSLVTLSKWESIYEKPFLGSEEKTEEETFTYVRLMLLDQEIPPEVFSRIVATKLPEISAYIDKKMSATWFNEFQNTGPKSREVITSELIYYWMMSAQIPIECEEWHLNRLFTLIKIFGLKNSKPKKMGPGELARRNRELNAQRKAQLGTRG